MLRLAILRHAEAVPQGAAADRERRLTAAGRLMSELMGRYFRDTGLAPDLALVSPARRTRETFEGLLRGAGRDCKVAYRPELYNAACARLADIVAATAENVHFLLLVGHNPGFAELAADFAATGDKAVLASLRGHFPAPTLAVIDWAAQNWPQAVQGGGRLVDFVPREALAELYAGGRE